MRVTDGGSGSGCFAYIGVVGNDQVLNLNQPNCVTVSKIPEQESHSSSKYFLLPKGLTSVEFKLNVVMNASGRIHKLFLMC